MPAKDQPAMSASPASGPGRRRLFSRVWAPALAGLLVGALYLPRVDSVFYFLSGFEAQGMLLATAVAEGRGFVDLSLVGTPAHVREPPLFYLAVAGLIRVFGMKMLPFKILIWASYVGAAVMATILFQRRARPLLGLLATMALMSSPAFYIFLTGPKSDVFFIALALGSLLAIEAWSAAVDARHRNPSADGGGVIRLIGQGLLVGALILSAIMTRSLGLALAASGAGTLVLSRSSAPVKSRLAWAAVLLAPILIGVLAWNLRGSLAPNPAGYTYVDWYLMDLLPDSPEMTAVDFHAPLMGELPRISLAGLMGRALRHFYLYALYMGAMVHYPGWWSGDAGGGGLVGAMVHGLIFLVGVVFLLVVELRSGRWPVVIFLAVYYLPVLLWPMDDHRLLMPMAPLIVFYAFYALDRGVRAVLGRFHQGAEESRSGRRLGASALNNGLLALVAAGVIVSNLYHDFNYFRSVTKLPTVLSSPDFAYRFTSKSSYDSYRLLLWARQYTEPGAVLMYHSPPPCHLVSGHPCQSIPMVDDLGRARDFVVDGGADYVIVDEWGRSFTGGAGWFVERVSRPMVAAYPDDFEVVYQLPGTDSLVARVKRRD